MRTFLPAMCAAFFIRVRPASRKANPACMNITSSSATTNVSSAFGRNRDSNTRPRYSCVIPRCRPWPTASTTVTPTWPVCSSTASITISTRSRSTTASTFLIAATSFRATARDCPRPWPLGTDVDELLRFRYGSRDYLASSFQQDHVSPDVVQTADALLRADRPEAEAAQERQARRVLREDARLEGPDPGSLGALDHGREQLGADAPAALLLADVDAELRDAGVATAGRHRNGRDPAAHPPVTLGDEPVLGEMSAVPFLP